MNINGAHSKLKKCLTNVTLWCTLEIKKMSNKRGFDRILKIEYNFQHFTRNCEIKNFEEFERDGTDVYLWRAGLVNVKEK